MPNAEAQEMFMPVVLACPPVPEIRITLQGYCKFKWVRDNCQAIERYFNARDLREEVLTIMRLIDIIEESFLNFKK
jgi:hypothetical protein